MPGPVALLKKEYYGFPGNHFWKIILHLFSIKKPLTYPEKIRLLKKHEIALWDVFKSCRRAGAADSAIQCAEVNDIPHLLKNHPNIRKIFLNSRTAEKAFQEHFSKSVGIPFQCLPSTSPANASISFQEKLQAWRVIRAS